MEDRAARITQMFIDLEKNTSIKHKISIDVLRHAETIPGDEKMAFCMNHCLLIFGYAFNELGFSQEKKEVIFENFLNRLPSVIPDLTLYTGGIEDLSKMHSSPKSKQ